jgi:hypothetical protein
MPRNADGTFDWDAGEGDPVTSGAAISKVWADGTFDDIETTLEASLDRDGKGPMRAALELVNGSVGTPALSFDSDTNLGLYRGAADDMRLVANGADVVAVTAAGVAVTGEVTASTSLKSDLFTTSTTTSAMVCGSDADDASAVGVILDNGTASAQPFPLTNAAARLVSVRNNGTDKLSVDKDGDIIAPAAGASLVLHGTAANGASAVGVVLDNATTLSTAGAKIASFTNNGTDKLSVDPDGDIIAPAAGASLVLHGTVADGASAVGVVVDNSVSLADATAKIASFTNAGTEKAYIDKDGVVYAATSASTTVTAGTDWTLSGPNTVRRSAGLVVLHVFGTAGATSAWNSIGTVPAGYRPSVAWRGACEVYDSNVTTLFPGTVAIGTDGVVTVGYYDNGTSIVAVFAIGAGDTVQFWAAYPVA